MAKIHPKLKALLDLGRVSNLPSVVTNVMAAWVLAVVYVAYLFRRPKTVSGLFLLPVILILIVLASVRAHTQS